VKLNWRQQLFDFRSMDKIEQKRKALVLYSMSYIGSFVIYLFSYLSYSEGSLLSTILFSSATIIFINALASHFWTSIQFASYITCAMIFFLLIGLAFTGGFNNTALYWMFPMPIVIFTLLNYRLGLMLNSLLCVIIFVIINVPDFNLASYDVAVNIRFEVAYALTIMFAFISELVRSQSQQELVSLNKEKQRLAHTDQLTGLPNRHYLAQLDFSIEKDQANAAKFPMAVVMADIDFFKSVNDKYGHDVGDQILRYLATFFRRNVRSSDIVIRMGGEEFLMLFPYTQAKIAASICDKLNSSLAASPYQYKDVAITIGLSFGVAIAQSDQEIEVSTKQADKLLYLAKKNGRGRAETV